MTLSDKIIRLRKSGGLYFCSFFGESVNRQRIYTSKIM